MCLALILIIFLLYFYLYSISPWLINTNIPGFFGYTRHELPIILNAILIHYYFYILLISSLLLSLALIVAIFITKDLKVSFKAPKKEKINQKQKEVN